MVTMRRLVVAVLVALSLAACSPPPSAPVFEIGGRAVAGPTCPAVPASPAPGECDPRPVAGATLIVTDDAGHAVATLTTGDDGTFTANLPAGSYTITPQPASGLMGGAQPIELAVSATDHPTDLRVDYDTGIR